MGRGKNAVVGTLIGLSVAEPAIALIEHKQGQDCANKSAVAASDGANNKLDDDHKETLRVPISEGSVVQLPAPILHPSAWEAVSPVSAKKQRTQVPDDPVVFSISIATQPVFGWETG
jgi:hypothetical protein